jgi:hypothetical protein
MFDLLCIRKTIIYTSDYAFEIIIGDDIMLPFKNK